MNGVHVIDRDYLLARGQRVFLFARDLGLLRDIEETCGALREEAEQADALGTSMRQLAEEVGKLKPTKELDPDDRLAKVFASAQEYLRRRRSELARKRGFAAADPRLSEVDGVVAACDEAIASIRGLFDATSELIDAIAEHDATAGATDAPAFTSADDVIAFLNRP